MFRVPWKPQPEENARNSAPRLLPTVTPGPMLRTGRLPGRLVWNNTQLSAAPVQSEEGRAILRFNFRHINGFQLLHLFELTQELHSERAYLVTARGLESRTA